MSLFLAAAEGAASITLPWMAWTAIASALITAIIWLAKRWESSMSHSHETMLDITREALTAIGNNTEAMNELKRSIETRWCEGGEKGP